MPIIKYLFEILRPTSITNAALSITLLLWINQLNQLLLKIRKLLKNATAVEKMFRMVTKLVNIHVEMKDVRVLSSQRKDYDFIFKIYILPQTLMPVICVM